MTALQMEAAFPPAYARFGRTLCAPRPDAMPLTALFQPAALTELAGRYVGSFAPGSDRRAVLSMWSQYYLLALIPAAVAAALALRLDLPVTAVGMGVVLAPGGLPECLCLPHAGCGSQQDCPVRRLAPLLHGHLRPLAEALDGAGLPARVVWSNAGHVLVWSLGVVGGPEAERQAVRAAITAPDWAAAGGNPFAAAVRGAALTRRVCCLRDRLGMATCSTCPRRRTTTEKEH